MRQQRQGRSILCAAVAYEDLAALADFLLANCCADAETPCGVICND